MMNDADLSHILKSSATRHEAPPRLRRYIAMALREQSSKQPRPETKKTNSRRWEWLRLSGAFACGLLVALAFVRPSTVGKNEDRLTEEVVANHVRSTMASHLTDVASLDQHTVKPWFIGKLTYSPPVHDLGSIGYPLVGGRLDYLDGQPAAALVYRRRLHDINVFVLPCQGTGTEPRLSTKRGYNLGEWCDGRMHYWVVSDLNTAEFGNFVAGLHEAEETVLRR